MRSLEPVFIRDIKLEILTSIATESNIHTILNEFQVCWQSNKNEEWYSDVALQQYVKSPNKDFVAATIQAIGRCAVNVAGSANRCLKQLMKLLHSTNGKGAWLHAPDMDSLFTPLQS